jgi:hypothetical protein
MPTPAAEGRTVAPSARLRDAQNPKLGYAAGLERDDFSLNRHPALAYCWSMIFSENRYPLFGIML